MVSAAASERPKWRTLPAAIRSFTAPAGDVRIDAALVEKIDVVRAEASIDPVYDTSRPGTPYPSTPFDRTVNRGQLGNKLKPEMNLFKHRFQPHLQTRSL
jgi:hypothetical protein